MCFKNAQPGVTLLSHTSLRVASSRKPSQSPLCKTVSSFYSHPRIALPASPDHLMFHKSGAFGFWRHICWIWASSKWTPLPRMIEKGVLLALSTFSYLMRSMKRTISGDAKRTALRAPKYELNIVVELLLTNTTRYQYFLHQRKLKG